MTERGSSYEEKYLTEDEISADTLSYIPEDADSDSENDSDFSGIGKRQNKILHHLPSTTRVFGEYFLKNSVHKNSQRICYKFLNKHSTADTLSDVPEDADSDSENDSDSSIIGNRRNKIVHPLPSTTGVFGEYFLEISIHKNSQRICYKFLNKHSTKVDLSC